MPAYEVQGPFGLQFNLQTHIPGTLSVVYNTPEDKFLAPGRTRSEPIGESSQGPSFGRRTQSELCLNIPMPISLSPPAADNAAPEQVASAPSPVPTEIIPMDLTQEEIVDDIQHRGIKVRDFAYENSPPVEERAPELFDPILAWQVYEALLANPDPKRTPINGRHLRRLIDIGWLNEEADGDRWMQKDREALEKFDSGYHYPWKALSLSKPAKEELKDVANARFQWVNADQLRSQFVGRVSRIPALFHRLRPMYQHQKRSAENTAELEDDPEVSPRSKKRRLSTSAASPSPDAESLSNVYVPLTLVNGKPPQQFPAGHPSASSSSPPRAAVAASPQPTLNRSLQRQLSMSTVSSPFPSDISRSDSRTPLAQGAGQE